MFDTKEERVKYMENPDNWKTVDFTKFVVVRNLKDTPIYRIYAHDTKGNEILLSMFMSENGMLLRKTPMNDKELLSYLTYAEEEKL